MRLLAALVEEEVDNTYCFQLLSPGFCERLVAESHNFRASIKTDIPASNVNLDSMGLGGFADYLLHKVVIPFAGQLYKGVGGGTVSG